MKKINISYIINNLVTLKIYSLYIEHYKEHLHLLSRFSTEKLI